MSKQAALQLLTIYNINVIDDNPTLGSVENVLLNPTSNEKQTWNSKYDEEVNKLLDEVKEELLCNVSDKPLENYDFPKDTHHVGPIPDWYQEMLQSKLRVAKDRLEKLSNLVCKASPSTAAHIKRIEADHNTVFCKMDYPKHPPLDKPWRNSWKFFCHITCKDNNPDHSHTVDCQKIVIDVGSARVSIESPKISPNDYPRHVIRAVKLFQQFANDIAKKKLFSDSVEDAKTMYDSNMWNTIRIIMISNHLNELMMIICGKRVTPLVPLIKIYFESSYVLESSSNLTTVYYIDEKLRRKHRKKAKIVTGASELKNKVGPILMQYDVITHRFPFNSIETIQIGKTIQDYMCLTKETTLLHFGCDFGVLSLIMAHKCEKVIGLHMKENDMLMLDEAVRLKQINKINNVMFLGCKPKEILSACLPLTENCITVAILNLSSQYGKSRHVMQALRDIPSIWRVLIYGSFDDEFHENIAVLVSEDDTMGERFLPMQGCIVDKSPSTVNYFDIVILFERKSLIATKLELLAPGPTLNVDSEDYDYESSDVPELKSESPIDCIENSKKKSDGKMQLSPFVSLESSISVREDCQLNTSPTEEYPTLPSLPHHSQSSSKEFQFNYPPPNFQSFSSPHNFYESIPTVRNNFGLFSYLPSPICQTNYPPPPIQSFSNSSHVPYPPHLVGNEYQFNYPPPILQNFSNGYFSHYPPTVTNDYQFNYLPPLSERISNTPLLSYSSLLSNPPPPLEKFPSPPPPPPPPPLEETMSLLENNNPHAIVKTESAQIYDDKENKASNSTKDGVSKVSIESKTPDLNLLENNRENITLPGTIKLEHTNSPKISDKPTNLKNEPEDMEISPNNSDNESMQTPIHNPTADNSHFPSPKAHEKVTVNDIDFPVQAHQSFLDTKLELKLPSVFGEIDEKEPGEITDSSDEVEVIEEKEHKKFKSIILVKPVDDMISKHCDDDRSTSYSQSPSPLSYRDLLLNFKKHRRSPSPNDRHYRRSLSPDDRFYREKSPSDKYHSKRKTYRRKKYSDSSRKRHRRRKRSRSRSRL